MAAEPSNRGLPWPWLIAGLLIGGVSVALTVGNRTEPPANTDQAKVLKHLEKLNKRLDRLEARPVTVIAPAGQSSRSASQGSNQDTVARTGSSQAAGLAPADGQAGQPNRNSQRKPTPRDTPFEYVDDGHEFEDGVVVDFKPTAPAAKNPIPASAQNSKVSPAEAALQYKKSFPEGCPTCE